ncbi:MAG: tetratricopeptide repeat protein [Ignavibacteriales bacterium]|nr:tetratricopeptide repeat protein [Ignavibacteriales bacterium]
MKRITLFLMVVFLAANVLAQTKVETAQKAFDKKDYKTAFTLAKELLDAGDATGANRFFIQLREVNYEPRVVFEYLGDSYVKMGVNELAISNFEEAEKLDSLNIDLKFKTANLLAKNLSNVTPAINKYIKIIQIEPQNSKAYFEAANLFFRAKEFIDAGKMYEEYLKLEKNKESYFNITKAFYEARSWEKTYEYGLKTLELYGENVLISKYVATAATQLKKYDDAAKYYAMIPDSMLTVDELERIGRIFQMVKDDANSMKYFEKVVKAEPARSSIYMELANGFFRDKKYDEAAKYYEAKAKADSTNETAWRYLGFSHYQFRENADSVAANPNFKKNQLEKARTALLRSVALNDTNFTNRNFLIQIYTALDSTQALLNQHKEMLSFIGNNETQYKDQYIASNSALGYNAYDRKAYAAAIPYYLRLLKYKTDISILKILMSCYLQSGNNDEAINFARRIQKISPKDKDAAKVLRALSAD